MKDIADVITKVRFMYHSNACSVNNALNQMHIISDEKANERNKNHVTVILADILPRLGKDTSEFFQTETKD